MHNAFVFVGTMDWRWVNMLVAKKMKEAKITDFIPGLSVNNEHTTRQAIYEFAYHIS
jgi:hypothetical protein